MPGPVRPRARSPSARGLPEQTQYTVFTDASGKGFAAFDILRFVGGESQLLEERTVRFDLPIQWQRGLWLPTPTMFEMAGMLGAIRAANEWLPLRGPILGASSSDAAPAACPASSSDAAPAPCPEARLTVHKDNIHAVTYAAMPEVDLDTEGMAAEGLEHLVPMVVALHATN